MQEKFLLFGMSLTLLSSNFVCSQITIPPHGGNSKNHICNLHPVTDHNSGWRRIDFKNGPTSPIVNLDIEHWDVLYHHTESNESCDESNIKVSASRSVTHSCSVGGSLTLGGSVQAAGGALFAKCAATASASVEINGKLSASASETVLIESSASIRPCKAKSYTFEKLRKQASGVIDTFDHEITCRYIPQGKTTDTKSYCNPTSLSGLAVGWGTSRARWSDAGAVPCPCDEDELIVQEPIKRK